MEGISEAENSSKPLVVVVAVDDGPHSEAAFHTAVKTFPRESTCYHLVHVRPDKDDSVLASISPDFKRYSHQVELREQRHSRAVLDKFERLAGAEGVQHTAVELLARSHWTISTRDPREALCKYCTSVHADSIVLGCRGMGPFKRMLERSVSSFCQHRACCPVVVEHNGTNLAAETSSAA